MKIYHTIAPVYNENSKILILGTMPSPKSREHEFYYMHPQNRFWRVISNLLAEPLPASNDEHKALLLLHGIALWDVLASCEIDGADDSSIKKPVANNLSVITGATDIKAVFATGAKAAQLYKKYCLPETGIEAVALPSSSPANCRWYTYDDLIREYSVILEYLR